MNRKDFLRSLLGAVPISVIASEVKRDDEPKGFGWITDPVKLSMAQRKSWKERIEHEVKAMFFILDIRVNVIATYHEEEQRFHLAICREAYRRDQYFTMYEGWNLYEV